MKVGPVIDALSESAQARLIHTGQHYDERMSKSFFDDLGLPTPDVNLGVGSGTHAEQTAGVLVAFERYLQEHPADAVVVVGDVNSTIACALAAVKLHVPVAHIEAGLRSGDRAMPEEINRLLTDRISRWLFTTSAEADANLVAEGVTPAWIHRVGNVMIDTLVANLGRARSRATQLCDRLGLPPDYGVLTLHRPSNVDDPRSIQAMLDAIVDGADGLPLVLPIHPRTAAKLASSGLELPQGIRVVEPLGYLDFIALVDGAKLVVTDSGGVQEETSVLGVPCVTARDTTERPITCELGTNVLAGTESAAITRAVRDARQRPRTPAEIPLWDGHAAERIVEVLLPELAERQ